MRIRTAVAATALAAVTLLGGAGAATAMTPGSGPHGGNYGVNSEFVSTWIKNSFNTIVVFGDNI
ncbi:hypothetical protein OG875_01485 [Streptomyces sp. NBC_01498]|uniref:hypothetical protein n=1 Tax=Streptomyces sp. NBC_01498 TaxID=2975870 RepID=UPI002E7B0BD7|nr:hypothetical protein [Streptomyces sp. NBC_01498]WTL23387.1 hypothetical protein OG875_01485 [Streptomyces sp. NBC_01498]